MYIGLIGFVGVQLLPTLVTLNVIVPLIGPAFIYSILTLLLVNNLRSKYSRGIELNP